MRDLETTRTLYIYVTNETVGLTSCQTSDRILCQGERPPWHAKDRFTRFR